MCIPTPKVQTGAAPIISAPRNAAANQSADIEARLRMLQAGAAASILTGPRGIPSTAKLGVPA